MAAEMPPRQNSAGGGTPTPGGNSKFFDAAGKRGEVQEFKEELNQTSLEKKKDALKRVIQAMTTGSDVSSLFPDVVNCMQTSCMDLKKLVYLYVINYAKAQPDLAILAIHSFRKDANDPNNPLLRALAVRTMGCIRLEQMTEYLLEPLRRSCKDADAYVRKTATICIAKLFDINPELVEEQGFLDVLRDMLGDSNPMVVANAVASLCEISNASRRNYLQLNEEVIGKLLLVLNECSEWHQVFILDALAQYDPPTSRTAEMILDRGVVIRLSHASSAVVLSAVKVMMKFMQKIQSPEIVRAHCKKMTPPLVTLLSAEPEIQYVVMRNINLIVQKQPQILQSDVRMFVCKYNDPLYVKLEKIAVMVQLASEKNVDQVLSEFREYASEVDIEVVRKSVRAIGQVAIKLSRATERCVDSLLELIKTKVNYVVQEAVVVIRDIFRKYPGKYEVIIQELCDNLDNLDEPEAKAAMVWIIGEYAERIDNSGELLEGFLESFHEESAAVQLQLLTATVKLCLKCPGASRELVGRVLKTATEDSPNPDLRDRGYMYWRMLSSNPDLARRVVLSERPTISDESFATQPRVLDQLVGNISTLASVYHQLPESFLDPRANERTLADHDSNEEEEEEDARETVERVQRELENRRRSGERYTEDSGDEGSIDGESASGSSSGGEGRGRGAGGPANRGGGGAGGGQGSQPPPPPLQPHPNVLSQTTPGQGRRAGLRVDAGLIRGPNGAVGLQMMLGNFGEEPMRDWAIQFNKNPFGFAPADQLQLPDLPTGGQPGQTTLPVVPNKQLSGAPPQLPLTLEVALKTNVDVFYFAVPYDLSAVLVDCGPAPRETFRQAWQQAPAERKVRTIGQFSQQVTPDMVVARCRQYFVYLVNQTSAPDSESLFLSAVTVNRLTVYCELMLQRGGPGVQLICFSEAQPLVPLFQAYISLLLRVRWQGQ
eukprot:TRINITY_DN54934_c0_g1_i1.p1 TRINITY_DN54934_c0_g1~~TRINITY_DN54934_c0_g1_i1.p1  ORF type:complete len:992 (-),score=268.54 TRINITY_DN54934_c0_g1_i1:90-2918(-)